jgi:hypothetical protein
MQDESGAVIFGTDFDQDRYDEILFEYFLKKNRTLAPRFSNFAKIDDEMQIERELFRVKWFDYRFIHPVSATYLFAYHWDKQYRLSYSKNVSRDAAENIRVQKDADLFKCPQAYITAMIRGRRITDAMGVPYEFAIAAGIKHTLRFWKRSHLPRPTQIFGDWVCEAIIADWNERKAELV